MSERPREALEAELHELRLGLKDLCHHLDIEWPGDELHLADVLEKYIGRELERRDVI